MKNWWYHQVWLNSQMLLSLANSWVGTLVLCHIKLRQLCHMKVQENSVIRCHLTLKSTLKQTAHMQYRPLHHRITLVTYPLNEVVFSLKSFRWLMPQAVIWFMLTNNNCSPAWTMLPKTKVQTSTSSLDRSKSKAHLISQLVRHQCALRVQ